MAIKRHKGPRKKLGIGGMVALNILFGLIAFGAGIAMVILGLNEKATEVVLIGFMATLNGLLLLVGAGLLFLRKVWAYWFNLGVWAYLLVLNLISMALALAQSATAGGGFRPQGLCGIIIGILAIHHMHRMIKELNEDANSRPEDPEEDWVDQSTSDWDNPEKDKSS